MIGQWNVKPDTCLIIPIMTSVLLHYYYNIGLVVIASDNVCLDLHSCHYSKYMYDPTFIT